MSTLNESPVYEQFLYRGKGKHKWELRNVSVKRSGCKGKYLVKVLPIQKKQILWRRKKGETIEITANSHCVVHMDTLGHQSSVVGLLHLRRGSQIHGHFFMSEQKEGLSNLKTILMDCCKVVSFQVDFDKALTCSPSQSTKAQLHVFHDKICLSTNVGYEFKLLREWPIDSLLQCYTEQENVTLIMAHEGNEERLVLRTDQGNDICSKLSECHQLFFPTVQEEFRQCDGNSNIMSNVERRLSKSCELLHHLHVPSKPLVLTSNSLSSTKRKLEFDSTRQSLSLSRLPFGNLEPKSPMPYEGSICNGEYNHHFSDSCTSSTEHFESCDNGVTVQKQLEFTALQVRHDANGGNHVDRELNTEGAKGLLPPPIPQRQLKHNLVKDAETTEQIKVELNCNGNYPQRHVDEFLIQRTRSFQIVEQPSSGTCTKRQRIKSESSIMMKTGITELVKPICVDPPCGNSGNLGGSYMCLQDNKATNATSLSSSALFSPKQDAEDIFSTAAGTEEGSEAFGSQPTVTQNRASPQPLWMSASADDALAGEKIQVKDEEQSSYSTCHYVNLPKGSRPSCYLYMNLPDLNNAPKEAPVYVNHVFMSRSMKGIYENVQQFYEKFEEVGASETTMAAPPLPPPALKPRQPPPRLPKRVSKAPQGVQPTPARIPAHTEVLLVPPPPRPPKRTEIVSKMPETQPSTQQQDIQVQIAVFASKAVAGRVWFLRIVVMQHDPDDSTFKMVKDREIASNYHLMQTNPFSISSDIVVSLKHQCQDFKLTSENSQEVGYNIIKDLVHGFWFVVEFHLEHLGSDLDQFVGNVCVEPKDLPPGEKCPVNKRVNLGITEDFELKVPLRHFNCEQHGSLHRQESQASKHVIPDYAKRKHLCGLLDISSYQQNWRDVAGQLEFTLEEIKSIEDKAHRCHTFSPMEHVLSTWEQRDPLCSLDRLVSILRDIKRFDAVSDLGFPVDSESS